MTATQSPVWTKVCIIGNSYIGAVRKAYQSGEVKTDPYDIAFFASPGERFKNVDIVDGEISNIYLGDNESKSVKDYGTVVVYGDMPLPSHVLFAFRRVPAEKYSRAVRKSCLLAWLLGFNSYRLVSALVARQMPKVILLSRNYPVREETGTHDERVDGVNLIQEMLESASYLPAPRILFGDDGKPRQEFYNGSLNVAGDEPDRTKQPFHHLDHLNLAGGQVMLAAIVDYLRAE